MNNKIEDLLINALRRLTSREFIAFLLFIIFYVPKLVPNLPINQQDIAITAGAIATIAFAFIRTFGKISEKQIERDIEKARVDVEMFQSTLQQTKNIIKEKTII